MEKIHHDNAVILARRILQLLVKLELPPFVSRPGVVDVLGYAAPLGSGGLHHAKA